MDVEGSHPSQRRRSTIAKEWQLAVLKKLQSESVNPTEEQRSAAAAETGLDKKWVRKWFTRQRSKLAAARNRTERAPTFKLYSTPEHPPPYLPSPVSLESPSPPSTLDTQAIPHAHQTVLVTNDSSQKTAVVPHTTTIPTYSRDPLCNRYPDFSQFFHPGLLIHQSPWTNLYPCPVAFSTRLADLLSHASLARYPLSPFPESRYSVFSFPVVL
ncbi:hypothetical protein L210DRAFT_514840 [Boletus edulis BED1]|uniref:Homeobox domain-containing protein n=1 Tax=Boletus edulis BED1 TaxID=1328754 RepID=A0AAD4GHH9_BOLED|nr:hypothetical protein L210DRAFT_514840 [Boletus edulis BED1]